MPFEYLFINDGSSDQTLAVMRKLHQEHPESVRYLSFSRNFGKEAALYAGLKAAKGFCYRNGCRFTRSSKPFASDV